MPANFKFYNPENIIGWPEKLPKPDLWNPLAGRKLPKPLGSHVPRARPLARWGHARQGLGPNNKFNRAPFVALRPETKIFVHECRIPGTGVHNSIDE